MYERDVSAILILSFEETKYTKNPFQATILMNVVATAKLLKVERVSKIRAEF